MDVRLPDGTIIANVPEGTTKAQLREKLARNGYDVSGLADPAQESAPAGKPSFLKTMMDTSRAALGYAGDLHQGNKQVALGALRGVAGIGNKLLPGDRKAGIEGGMAALGADPESMAYGAGKLGAEIAGTAGLGGAMAKPVGAILGRVAPSVAPMVTNALRTAGMSTGAAPVGLAAKAGDLALRSGAGGAVGYTADRLIGGEGTAGAAVGAALPFAKPVIQGAGWLAKKALGGSTGVGDAALSQAFKAGRAGGAAADDLTASMRGTVPMDDVLAMAKQNLETMGQQKTAAYRSGMVNIKADKTVLDLTNIAKSADDALGMATFKGQVKNEPAAKAVQAIKQEIDNWRGLDPAEFHTPEGLDALKQRIGGIVESIPFEQKTALSAASKIYNSIKGEISKQAPEYSKVMGDYSAASDLIREIEKSLSLGQKASADTAMRKLQSLMRNNVNTSYGYRTDLAQQLGQAGGKDIMPAIAGQSLNEWLPRGIQRALAGTGGAALTLTGNPLTAAALAATSSPRLVGEGAYLAGKTARAMDNPLARLLKQGAYYAAPVGAAQD